MNILNISAYKFIDLQKMNTLRGELFKNCQENGLKGTILLSPEGINLILAAPEEAIEGFVQYLCADSRFSDMTFKRSYSESIPFKRLFVKVKNEIITLKEPGIAPQKETVPHLSAEALKQWLDEGREFTLLDTRNDYEIEFGTFEKAIDLDIEQFRDFPNAAKQLPETMKAKPLVMFCTGGVRCEKAGPVLSKQGFTDVYQLDGGILKYFETCHDAHYRGHCFVFDDRVALDPDLNVVTG